VKERPILFSGDMVRAILEGRKTQTRRVIKPQPIPCEDGSFDWRGDNYEILPRRLCPYGREGDRLWVRETWAAIWPDVYDVPLEKCNIEYRADINALYPGNWPADEARGNPEAPKWRPSIFMPRWASRITLDVTSITVERIQDISEEDASAEGCNLEWYRDEAGSGEIWPCPLCQGWQVYPALGANLGVTENDCDECNTSRKMFKHLWNSINDKRGYSWDSNPWVWVVEFRIVTNDPT